MAAHSHSNPNLRLAQRLIATAALVGWWGVSANATIYAARKRPSSGVLGTLQNAGGAPDALWFYPTLTVVELVILLAILRPLSYDRSWVRALVALFMTTLWHSYGVGSSGLSSGRVAAQHGGWLIVVIVALLLLFIVSALSTLAAKMAPTFVREHGAIAGTIVSAMGMVLFLGVVSIELNGDTKVAAYTWAMASDLREVAVAQAEFYRSHGSYVASLAELSDESGQPFRPSAGVTIRIDQADARGWHAIAAHSQMDLVCRVGDVAPPRPKAEYADFATGCHRLR